MGGGNNIKNLFSILSMFVLVLVVGMVLGNSSAQASVPQYSFQTEDGNWDGEIGNPNRGSDLQVELVSPII